MLAKWVRLFVATPIMSWDVFVSFKNLDERGLPTRDSAFAKEIYDSLVGQGLSVFIRPTTHKKAIDDALDAASIVVAMSRNLGW